MKDTYADQFCDWLVEEGYTHCFFVAGGNIMHLLNSARFRFHCVPVIHEVAAGVATEYFNKTSNGKKAFALVTAGPGVTNILTAMAGAWLESRELLVVAGQVKSSDLATHEIRQRGIQEIDGVSIATSVSKKAVRVTSPLSKSEVVALVRSSGERKPGPVFIEFCLDLQATPAESELESQISDFQSQVILPSVTQIDNLVSALGDAHRPVLLLGGGINRSRFLEVFDKVENLGIPILTTWNGLDLIDSRHPLYWGRPNTWGQRQANILIQQADFVLALGTRLGLQQTGFNWQGFAPNAHVIQVDIDPAELSKGHPKLHSSICADASSVISELCNREIHADHEKWNEWRKFGTKVREITPVNEDSNSRNPAYLNPYDFVESLSDVLSSDDVVVPCSSGGGFTTMMQAFRQKIGQRYVTNKGLASMGYGLSGAIGAAYANPGRRIILVEGDGGFAQNIQEVGTVVIGKLPIKFFIYVNGGYASIRMTQANYFNGGYVGCDRSTGLGLPNFVEFFNSYGVETFTLNPSEPFSQKVTTALNSDQPTAFIVPIDPEQTYFPKITSRVLPNGNMESNPLHLMTPDLPSDIASQVFKYIDVPTYH